ncbi:MULTISPECIES: TetR/AcrR family transcriptional regulator [unclassified Curtobacterium]|uniref:TetR/AcrR family transcriptional regulator n=1 Tax=unclassified Curtobacterium TaxID=257496 RepID=UPI0015E8E943|nr:MULTISPECIES: TetR/AcrR family transcriptional regulator [unclassified Curtobacterium]WIE54600.1 TetR/AcrR family transcriptional regulator [Curtobacterium sp. MCBD17_003]
MHCASQSAKLQSVNTSERTRLLRRRMIATARRRTIADGLNGFTIEQLCEEVGVSRRTFFNHFASKEDVVLGIELGVEDDLLATFAAGAAVDPDLAPFEAAVALAIEHLHVVGLDRGEEALMRDVLEREPSLVARFVTATDRQMNLVGDAMRSRFGWTDPADDRGRLVAEIIGALLKATAWRFFADDDGPPFEDILRANFRLVTAMANSDSPAVPASSAPLSAAHSINELEHTP